MLSVRGVYDGKQVIFSEEIKFDAPQNVIVTFLGDSLNDTQTSAFDFLNDPAEDIYSDNDLKVKTTDEK